MQQFLSPFRIALPLDPAHVASWPPEERFSVTAVNDTIDEQAGTRSLTLRIDHPGLIWTGEEDGTLFSTRHSLTMLS